MITLSEAMQTISTNWNNKLVELTPGVYRLDVGLKLKDETIRYQFVYVWQVKNQNGRDHVFMNSRAGMYNNNLNLYQLLKDSGSGYYSTITIVPDKNAEGNPCETVVVQASPYLDSLSVELLGDIIFEVANEADWLEEKHFGGDTN